MENAELYANGHLIVAAIRLLQHQRKSSPTMEDICQLLAFSLEKGYLICKKIIEMKVIESIKGPFGIRLTIKDHLLLENIPKTETSDNKSRPFKLNRHRNKKTLFPKSKNSLSPV